MVQVVRMQSLEFILRAVTLQELNYPENENFRGAEDRQQEDCQIDLGGKGWTLESLRE